MLVDAQFIARLASPDEFLHLPLMMEEISGGEVEVERDGNEGEHGDGVYDFCKSHCA